MALNLSSLLMNHVISAFVDSISLTNTSTLGSFGLEMISCPLSFASSLDMACEKYSI